jgi:hypothetical protein
MVTEKQIAANRLNAQKCTGPRTPAGKAASSRNAFKTGIYSQAEVTKFESQPDYDQLIADFRAHYAPANIEEACLLDALIRHEWLSRRYMCAEAAVWNKPRYDPKTDNLAGVFAWDPETIARASQLYNAARRAFNATLKLLREAQRRRAEQPEADETPETQPETIAATILTPELVSFREPLNPAPISSQHVPELEAIDPPIAA